jgi:hypothetical protein
MTSKAQSAVAPAEEGAEEAAGGDESSSSDVRSDEDDADLPDEPADEELSSATGAPSPKTAILEGRGRRRGGRGRVSVANINAPGVF